MPYSIVSSDGLSLHFTDKLLADKYHEDILKVKTKYYLLLRKDNTIPINLEFEKLAELYKGELN